MRKRLRSILLLLLSFILFTATSCLSAAEYYIDVPDETLSAECGEYIFPQYNVVDADGNIQTGYTVRVRQVLDPDDDNVVLSLDGTKIYANVEGVYKITYTADNNNVEEGVLKVRFTRSATAPTIIIDEASEIPQAYIQGFEYYAPYFIYGAGADLTKSYMTITHVSEDDEETEIVLVDNKFTAQFDEGNYEILIHVESASGLYNDYTYTVRAVAGPQEVVEGKIGYFDDPFGVEQFWTLSSELKYTTEISYGDESGSMEVTIKSDSLGVYGEMINMIQKDVSDYDYLVYRVYNPNNFDVTVVFSEWFGLVNCPKNEWTEAKIPVGAIIDHSGTDYIGSPKIVSLEDITGLVFHVYAYDDVTTQYQPLPAGSKIYLSAMYAEKMPELDPGLVEEGKIAYFDNVYGVYQLKQMLNANARFEFSTEQKYGDEAGSVKVTIVEASAGYSYAQLARPYITDVSSYDYIVFYLYNAGTESLFAGVETQPGGTWAQNYSPLCPAGQWTKIKVQVANLASAEDITDLTLGIATTAWASPAQNTVIYLSAMYGIMEGQDGPNTVVPDKIGYFDEQYGIWQLSVFNDNAEFELSTEQKYGSETGSLKVTITQENLGYSFAALTEPYITDVSVYDYIVFYLYNAGDQSFYGGVETNALWANVTPLCQTGVWTEIKVPTANLTSATDITGLTIGIATSGWASPAQNTVIYLSAMYGVKESGQEGPGAVVPDKIGYFDEEYGVGQVSVFNENAEFEFSTEQSYGDEAGSLKVTITGENAGYTFAIFEAPYITDVSVYDYIVFYLYNASAEAVFAGVETNGTWAGGVSPVCQPGQWTEIKVPTANLTSASDITGLTIGISTGTWASVPSGTIVYLSALYGE